MKRTKKRGKPPFLSVIVPVYNEELRAPNGLSKIAAYLKKKRYTTELIVVNDGSTDATSTVLEKLKKKHNFEIVSYQGNRGKGYAIRTGMLHARGKFRLFLDVDLSTPIESLDLFFPYLGKHDVIIGSRRAQGANVVIRQPTLRENMGHIFTTLSKVVLSTPVSDFTCGFKCFRDTTALFIFNRSLINGWGFDSEILYLAHRKGFTIKEIPVTWKNDIRTKVRFPQDILRSLSDLMKIRFYPYDM